MILISFTVIIFNSIWFSNCVKKFILCLFIGFFIAVYFLLILFIFPEYYLSKEILVSQPYFEAVVSKSEISVGDSFDLMITSENKGDYGDIHILSVGFPNLTEINNDVIQITTYDFTQSLTYLSSGDMVSTGYSTGVNSTLSQYPSIEAINRPVFSNTQNHLAMSITPESSGPFLLYVKTINIPHIDMRSHYPQSGVLDQQDEYVSVFSVNVIP